MVVAITLVPALLSIAGGRVARGRAAPRGDAERTPRLPAPAHPHGRSRVVAAVLTIAAAARRRERAARDDARDRASRAACRRTPAPASPPTRSTPASRRACAGRPSCCSRGRAWPPTRPPSRGWRRRCAPSRGSPAWWARATPVQETPLADVLPTPDGNAARMLVVLRDDPTEHQAIATDPPPAGAPARPSGRRRPRRRERVARGRLGARDGDGRRHQRRAPAGRDRGRAGQPAAARPLPARRGRAALPAGGQHAQRGRVAGPRDLRLPGPARRGPARLLHPVRHRGPAPGPGVRLQHLPGRPGVGRGRPRRDGRRPCGAPGARAGGTIAVAGPRPGRQLRPAGDHPARRPCTSSRS